MPEFENFGIVGLGLLGSSLGLAVKKRKLAKNVFGWTRTPETIAKAKKNEIIDKEFASFQEFINNVDFLILCAPIFSNNKYIKDIVQLKPKLFFTDIGSTKSSIVKYVDDCFADLHNFVGSHPMAGSEKKGIDFADADIFKDKTVILTPSKKSSSSAITKIKNFWENLGGKTFVIDADKHDEIVAYTSHLPHGVIFALCRAFKEEINKKEFLLSIGSGLKDTTRIAGSSLDIWTEIFLDNSSNVLLSMERFKKELNVFQDILKNRDINRLKKFLEEAKNIREIINKNGQEKDSKKN